MRILILKDSEQNTLLETRLLKETDNIKYTILENPPEIEQREGYTGRYDFDTEGNLIVVYEKIPKTEIELIKEELAAEKARNEELEAANFELVDYVLSLDERLTNIENL